jgi:hypothetical protein
MFIMLVVTLVTGLSVSVHAQDETQSATAAPERMRQEMTAMRQQMMAEEQAANARLQALLERLAAAEGDGRIDAITSRHVVTSKGEL